MSVSASFNKPCSSWNLSNLCSLVCLCGFPPSLWAAVSGFLCLMRVWTAVFKELHSLLRQNNYSPWFHPLYCLINFHKIVQFISNQSRSLFIINLSGWRFGVIIWNSLSCSQTLFSLQAGRLFSCNQSLLWMSLCIFLLLLSAAYFSSGAPLTSQAVVV